MNYHGSEEGLDKLKEQAKASPLPPAGFAIESATAVANRKQKEFETSTRSSRCGSASRASSPAAGRAVLRESLKNAAVPKLKGMVVEGKPACRSKEILVSVPEPDRRYAASGNHTEARRRADRQARTRRDPVRGRPSAFKPDPFMLTMDTEKAKIEGLKTTPCAAAPAGRAARRPRRPPQKKK